MGSLGEETGWASHLDTNVKAHVLPDTTRKKTDTASEPLPFPGQPNYLCLAPRIVSVGGTQFESDGPGHLAEAGARHDNDFVNIENIRILPTTDEILSLRSPYMPFKRFTRPHFLPRGPQRLLDTLFRQLRYENVEILKDCVYFAAQKLLTTETAPSDYDPCQDTPNGNRHYLYWGAKFEELIFHDRKGLLVRVSYACPRKLRGSRIFTSGRFENGMVVALVGIDEDGVSLSATFFETYLCQSTDSMVSRGGKGKRAAVQLRFAQPEDVDDLQRTVYYSQGLASGRFVLVEFPRHLLNGFYPILKRLQLLRESDLGFARYYAPRSKAEENVGILPPSYTAVEEASIDFQRLSSSPSDELCRQRSLRNLIADKDEFLRLAKQTSLDEGQAVAFVESMCNEVALVQGPPGTGKTYIGTALVQAILSAIDSSRTPILAVCMTNHALDAFLKELLEKGIKKIARLGGGSREDWTKKYTLKSLTSSMKVDVLDRQLKAKEYSKVKALSLDGAEICEAVNSADKLGWFTLSQHLRDNYKDIYQQLILAAQTNRNIYESGIDKRVGGFPYALWSSGGDLDVFDAKINQDFAAFLGQNSLEEDDPSINFEIVQNVLQDIISQIRDKCKSTSGNIWMLSHLERKQLMAKWASEIDIEVIANNIVDIQLQHQTAVSRLDLHRENTDAACLGMQQVIGVTTTACASKWPLLNRLGLRIVICEEAGEVMEAHSLCTLFPTVEHAIFIGDPLQLRPRLSEQSLSVEMKLGSEYRLDESLFERLTDPDSGIRTLPRAILSVQRRMHPEISTIPRTILYPHLKDHPSTLIHPDVGGLAHRTYWFDHTVPEDQYQGFSSATKSFSNRFEVDMVGGLVQYLVRSNAYGLGDIAILTPYSGQLAQLVRTLHGTCSLWLNENDKQTLLDEGFLTEEMLEAQGRVEVDMAEMLRISTIDNFQGEEAKVVILTTVRSNPECRPGFLKTVNRINVACSRARDGFYIFGNSQSLAVVPMWNDIINLFHRKNRLGTTINIRSCSRNPDHSPGYFPVRVPADFDRIPPCITPCNEVLSCGHICTESCHPFEFHDTPAMRCRQKCNKIHNICGHPCSKECGESCGPCTVTLTAAALPCGHVMMPTCADMTSGVAPLCQATVGELTLICGHRYVVKCAFKDEKPACYEPCAAIFQCGHHCTGVCQTCTRTTSHVPCAQKCGQKLECQHTCNAKCHPDTPCPPCEQPCQKRCAHGQCRNSCTEPCPPCTRFSGRSCEHREIEPMLCPLASSVVPCNIVSEHKLKCGHIIPTICGENTSGFCRECTTGIKETSPTMNLSCGHVVYVEELDRHVGLPEIIQLHPDGSLDRVDAGSLNSANLFCPVCLAKFDNIPRYSILTGLQRLPENIDSLLLNVGQKYQMLGKRLLYHEKALRDTFKSFREEIRPTPLSAAQNRLLVQERASGLAEVRTHILETKEQLVMPLERNLIFLHKQLHNGNLLSKTNFHFGIRFVLLFYRCRYAFLRDQIKISSFLLALDDPSYQTRILAESLRRTAIMHGKDTIGKLGSITVECESKLLKTLEVETRLLQLGFYCLVKRGQRLNCFQGKDLTDDANITSDEPDDDIIADLGGKGPEKFDINSSIRKMALLCRQYPKSAGLYVEQIESIRHEVHSGFKPVYLFPAETRVVERAWGMASRQGLSKCENFHFYPAADFDECPECGKEEVEADKPNYETFLAEEKFLCWMRSGSQD